MWLKAQGSVPSSLRPSCVVTQVTSSVKPLTTSRYLSAIFFASVRLTPAGSESWTQSDPSSR